MSAVTTSSPARAAARRRLARRAAAAAAAASPSASLRALRELRLELRDYPARAGAAAERDGSGGSATEPATVVGQRG
jgi:hypothetical protein